MAPTKNKRALPKNHRTNGTQQIEKMIFRATFCARRAKIRKLVNPLIDPIAPRKTTITRLTNLGWLGSYDGSKLATPKISPILNADALSSMKGRRFILLIVAYSL